MASSNNSLSSLNVVGYTHTPPNNHLSSLSHVTLITVTVLAVAVTVSLAFYFLLRYRSRFLRRSSPSIAEVFSSANRISPETASSSVADSLPTFAFSSVTRHGGGGSGDGDCAVCLSKFEQHDLLRLLPLCCHAFHAECIDTWLRSNLTCPLCRSAVVGSESDLAKVFRSSSVAGGDSFRLEIGNISSSRRGAATSAGGGETRGRSYSVGAFEYFIDEEAEVAFSYAHRRSVSGEKDDGDPAEPLPSLAGEVERGGSSNNDSNSWLKDYVDRLSNTMSFRSSGRFFTGNSRRSDVVAGGDYDVEANRFGDEIGEVFRWLSGV
ncbi:E3 ubiquitin-protein ligase ATL4 [Cajanus cajan]|uniref:E3 ubiquitin-protein ligase ATL4 n=1 Tax=Cajanus cajan TaxID=3821 RepID=UPI00098DBAC6|nr:E3 ubiquitin-protein ligase ATL4 [Cajanus cajan]